MDHACTAYSFISVPLYDTLGIFYLTFYFFFSNIPTVFDKANRTFSICLFWLQVQMLCTSHFLCNTF
ncbi:hypothetical protein KSS87_008795 [Heliosperma pusillum]|nr:hypothetical protein KSS87_006607 [Heliosperma pusillum]KAH9612321.1 hypothetical protein KSS87_006607 [Heliosperma pusillum]KAH9612322.1 hypothetical protein KSS87_006607 [Heliosperma pusillum]KAH9614361.1 hypothetical protein KSS87_008795 [Heliosperma pusillum]KAH9614362.1 hypothetical protein KSS87_008795 [Heliosperma pusillum]